MPRAKLQWATGYDLRSLGIRDVRRAIAYVRNQNQRHPDMALGLCVLKDALPAERALSGRE